MKIIGVRFKKLGKIYHFDPGDTNVEKGQAVIVETIRGVEYGIAEIPNKEVPKDPSAAPLKKLLRIATPKDDQAYLENKRKAKEAFDVCTKKIAKHNLDMKLVDVEYTFDHNKIIFYFTSDGRVDFRELVKELATVFRTRIELRQIGVRDEAKMLNGIGICGRTLCCATYLGDFHPVSIKMAKDQGLSLNPTKISGICGRLMCCLKHEQDTYEYLAKTSPRDGDFVNTPEGNGYVLSTNLLRQIVKVSIKLKPQDDPSIRFYAVDEVEVLPKNNRPKDKAAPAEDKATPPKDAPATPKDKAKPSKDKAAPPKKRPKNKNSQTLEKELEQLLDE